LGIYNIASYSICAVGKLRVHLDLTKNNCNSAQAVVLGRISTRHRLQLSSAAVIEEFVDMRVSP
jgi:hypothetical protein